MRADIVQQLDKFAHKLMLRAIFRRTEFGIAAFGSLSTPKQIPPVIHFQPPRPAIDPFAQLAAASQILVNESRMNIDDAIFIAESRFCRTSDKFLPNRPRPSRRRVDLKLKRPLEPDPIQHVSKQQRESRRRNKNLHRIKPADLKPIDRTALALNILYPNLINLPGEPPSDELLDLQPNGPLTPSRNLGNFVTKLRPRLIPPDTHRPMQTGIG